MMNPRELGGAAVRGSLSTFAGSFGGFLVRLAVNVALARMLLPEQFGQFGFALVYAELLAVLGAFSFSQALLQLDDSHTNVVGTVLRLEVAVGLALFGLSLALAPVVDLVHPDSPVVAECFVLLGAGRVASQTAAAMMATLQREFRFDGAATMHFAATSTSALAALLWAYFDPSPFTLVVRDVGASVIVVAVLGVHLTRALGRGLFSYDRRTARATLRLGRALFFNRALEIGYQRVDQFVVGSVLGEKALGFFVQARYLAGLPSALVAPMAGVVGLRTLAAVGDDRARRSRVFTLVQFAMSRLLFAFAVGAIVAPGLVVRILLGPGWEPTAELLRLFGAWLVASALAANYKVLLMAVFDFRWMNLATLAAVISLTASVYPFTHFLGAAGAALATIVAASTRLVVLKHRAKAHVTLQPGTYGAGVIASVVAAGAGLYVGGLPLELPQTTQELGALAAAFTLFVAVIWMLERDRLKHDLRYVLSHLRRRR